MKAWILKRNSNKYELTEVPKPTIKEDEILIKSKVCMMSYNLVWAESGHPLDMNNLYNRDYTIFGTDGAGIVEQVGKNISNVKVGDEIVVYSIMDNKVFGYETTNGLLGEYAVVKEDMCYPKPKHLDWKDCSVGGYGTNLQALKNCNYTKDDVVLVWGGSGSCGTTAIELCKKLGLSVYTITSDCFTTNNADLSFNRTKFDLNLKSSLKMMRKSMKSSKGLPTIIIDYLGKDTLDFSLKLLDKKGKVVIYGAHTGYDVSFDSRYLWLDEKQIIGSHYCSRKNFKKSLELMKDLKPNSTPHSIYDFESVLNELKQNKLNGLNSLIW
tara:strand:- start:3604 stop:4578 length:975 start_codon:yes stop_codon:yes gene_type:complete